VDKNVRRITAVSRSGTGSESVVIYRDPKKKRKVSALSSPFEKVVRRLINASVKGYTEAQRRHEKSNSERRDGWLRDAPENIIKSSRKAYNESRKIAPFRILPKA
jgi:hypothetical protein